MLRLISSRPTFFSKDLGVHCRLFPIIVKRLTLEWYYSLPCNFTWLIKKFCARFLTQFADFKSMVTTSTSLQHITQGDVESLWQYITQFTKTSINIPNLHPMIGMHILLVGLRLEVSLDSLYVIHPPIWMHSIPM